MTAAIFVRYDQAARAANESRETGIELGRDHVLIGRAASIPVSEPTPVISVAPVALPAPGRPVDLQVRISAPTTGAGLPVILLSHGGGPSNYLSSLLGYGPLVDFWAVWCGYCYDTIPHLVEMNKEYKDKGLEIIGLTSYYKTYGFNKETGRGKRLTEKLTKEDEQKMLKELAAHHKMDYRIQAVEPAEMKTRPPGEREADYRQREQQPAEGRTRLP